MKNISIFLILLFLAACQSNFSPEEKKYIEEVEKFRNEKDIEMRDSSYSPFNFKKHVEFHPLNYFDVDPSFKYQSKLNLFESKDTITVFGTKGETRKAVRYGYVTINRDGKKFDINVYEGTTPTGKNYYSIWFTDKTTNEETYGVGRYLNFQLQEDPNYLYTIDFNLAYNPYCAYSSAYSCAIPSKDDYLDLEIRAGEKKFHK